MNLTTIIIIGLGLAMDAFSVAIASGAAYKESHRQLAGRMSVLFGVFQAGMPLIGWWVGTGLLRPYIQAFDHWVAFGLLTVIGGKMILEAFEIEQESKHTMSKRVLLLLSVATSIDALAVGVTLSLFTDDVFGAVIVIGLITLVLSYLGVYIGKHFGHLLESKIEIVGGLILIAVGVKILIQGLAA